MSDHAKNALATIMFDGQIDVDFASLIAELQRPFRNIALEFEQTALAPDSHAVFIAEDMVLRISKVHVDEEDLLADTAKRPEKSRFSSDLVDAMLEDVQDTLEIAVEDGPGGKCPDSIKLTACYHVTRHLLRNREASLVHWHFTDTLYVSEEFDLPQGLGYTPQPRRPSRAYDMVMTERPAQPLLEADIRRAEENLRARKEAEQKNRFEESHLAVADTHNRLDEQMLNVVRMVNEEAEAVSDEERMVVIDPSREEDRLRRARNRIFAGDLIESVDMERQPPEEPIGLPQQLAVYLMSITMMMLSFPVGFIMLVYNLVRGENVNLTARAMALTGVGVGMVSTTGVAQYLSILV